MNRRISTSVLCLCLFSALAPVTRAVADDDDKPSDSAVLIQSTPLIKGSLPEIVTAYGRVVADSSSVEAIMAPLSGIVEQILVRQGQTIPEGAPLVRLVPGPKTIAAYSQAKSAVNGADQLVGRTQRLLAEHLATDQQLSDAKKALLDARSELAAQEAQGAAGPSVLKAPFRAIVTSIGTSAGSIVSEGAALVNLARPTGLVLQVGVVPERASTIKSGDAARISPFAQGEPSAGKVTLRSAIVDATNGMVTTEIELPVGKFLLGEMASAAITTGEASGYLVPHAAVLVDDKGRTYIMQVVKDAAKKVTVRVLQSNDDQDVIEGDLDQKAPVVLAGNHQLDEGTKVRYAEATEKDGAKEAASKGETDQ